MQKLLSLSTEKLDEEIEKFKLNQSTFLIVTEYEKDYVKSINDEIQALVDYNKATIQLKKAMGIIIDVP